VTSLKKEISVSTLKELRERQAQVVVEARERLDLITNNTDESRAGELEASHDKAMAEYDRLEGLIARSEKVEAAERRADELRAKQRPIPRDGQVRGDDEGPAVEYRNVFFKVACGVAPSDLEPEEREVLRRGATKFEQRAQTAGTTTAGGFTVPTELASIIVRSMKAWGPMYDEDVATTITTPSGNSLKLPTVDDTAKSGAAHTEAAALTDDGSEDVTFGQKSLDAFSFDTEFLRWSWELDMDSIFSMEALLGDLLGERLGRIANAQLTTGTGSSAPNGIVTAATLGKTAASATAITADEIIDLLHTVDPAYRTSPKARFMFNDSTLSAVRKLKDGQGNYLWQMGDVSSNQPGTLLGYRYSINQGMASMAASARVMLFGDFGKYFVRKVGAPVVGILRERFWPDLGIAGLIRFDGELGDAAAVKYLRNA
jgi:HK97 family phage major capsid protein